MRKDNAMHDGLRMPVWMRRAIYGVGGLSLLSGGAWLLLHEFMQRAGEFGPQPHPLERSTLVLHGISAYAVLFVVGMIWLGHVRRGLQHRGYRFPSGLSTLVLLAFLVGSSLALYYMGDPEARDTTSTAHWVAGLLGAACLLAHGAPWRRRD